MKNFQYLSTTLATRLKRKPMITVKREVLKMIKSTSR